VHARDGASRVRAEDARRGRRDAQDRVVGLTGAGG
jgi:hypothetical protein